MHPYFKGLEVIKEIQPKGKDCSVVLLANTVANINDRV